MTIKIRMKQRVPRRRQQLHGGAILNKDALKRSIIWLFNAINTNGSTYTQKFHSPDRSIENDITNGFKIIDSSLLDKYDTNIIFEAISELGTHLWAAHYNISAETSMPTGVNTNLKNWIYGVWTYVNDNKGPSDSTNRSYGRKIFNLLSRYNEVYNTELNKRIQICQSKIDKLNEINLHNHEIFIVQKDDDIYKEFGEIDINSIQSSSSSPPPPSRKMLQLIQADIDSIENAKIQLNDAHKKYNLTYCENFDIHNIIRISDECVGKIIAVINVITEQVRIFNEVSLLQINFNHIIKQNALSPMPPPRTDIKKLADVPANYNIEVGRVLQIFQQQYHTFVDDLISGTKFGSDCPTYSFDESHLKCLKKIREIFDSNLLLLEMPYNVCGHVVTLTESDIHDVQLVQIVNEPNYENKRKMAIAQQIWNALSHNNNIITQILDTSNTASDKCDKQLSSITKESIQKNITICCGKYEAIRRDIGTVTLKLPDEIWKYLQLLNKFNVRNPIIYRQFQQSDAVPLININLTKNALYNEIVDALRTLINDYTHRQHELNQLLVQFDFQNCETPHINTNIQSPYDILVDKVDKPSQWEMFEDWRHYFSDFDWEEFMRLWRQYRARPLHRILAELFYFVPLDDSTDLVVSQDEFETYMDSLINGIKFKNTEHDLYGNFHLGYNPNYTVADKFTLSTRFSVYFLLQQVHAKFDQIKDSSGHHVNNTESYAIASVKGILMPNITHILRYIKKQTNANELLMYYQMRRVFIRPLALTLKLKGGYPTINFEQPINISRTAHDQYIPQYLRFLGQKKRQLFMEVDVRGFQKNYFVVNPLNPTIALANHYIAFMLIGSQQFDSLKNKNVEFTLFRNYLYLKNAMVTRKKFIKMTAQMAAIYGTLADKTKKIKCNIRRLEHIYETGPRTSDPQVAYYTFPATDIDIIQRFYQYLYNELSTITNLRRFFITKILERLLFSHSFYVLYLLTLNQYDKTTDIQMLFANYLTDAQAELSKAKQALTAAQAKPERTTFEKMSRQLAIKKAEHAISRLPLDPLISAAYALINNLMEKFKNKYLGMAEDSLVRFEYISAIRALLTKHRIVSVTKMSSLNLFKTGILIDVGRIYLKFDFPDYPEQSAIPYQISIGDLLLYRTGQIHKVQYHETVDTDKELPRGHIVKSYRSVPLGTYKRLIYRVNPGYEIFDSSKISTSTKEVFDRVYGEDRILVVDNKPTGSPNYVVSMDDYTREYEKYRDKIVYMTVATYEAKTWEQFVELELTSANNRSKREARPEIKYILDRIING